MCGTWQQRCTVHHGLCGHHSHSQDLCSHSTRAMHDLQSLCSNYKRQHMSNTCLRMSLRLWELNLRQSQFSHEICKRHRSVSRSPTCAYVEGRAFSHCILGFPEADYHLAIKTKDSSVFLLMELY